MSDIPQDPTTPRDPGLPLDPATPEEPGLDPRLPPDPDPDRIPPGDPPEPPIGDPDEDGTQIPTDIERAVAAMDDPGETGPAPIGQDAADTGAEAHDHVRVAGRSEMDLPPGKWDEVDEESDESFPASDPPGNY